MTFIEFIQLLLIAGLILFISICIVFTLIQKLTTEVYPVIKRHNDETTFLDPDTVEQVLFPSIEDEPSIELSVIIPAYNEEERLPKMMEECLDYLENRCKNEPSFSYEVIIVSDGSTDNTVQCALKYTKKFSCNKVRVLELVENRGKGGAVRLGMLSSRGKYLLFADADGATKFSDYEKLENQIKRLTLNDWQKLAVVIGSRAHLEEQAIATRSAFRTFLMHGFHFLVFLFAVKRIRDTQCGFKLFTRSAARILFKSLHVERWAFDVELLYIAQKLRIPIEEIAVNWTEIEGSKLQPFWSWLQMGTDLFLIWYRYLIRAWKIEKLHSR